MSLVEVGNGVRLNVVEQGAGKTILLVHGWPTNSRAWKHQLDALSAEHRVLAVDLRGFGDSPPVEQPRIALLAEDVRRLIDALGLEEVFLVGWSMGGCVVMSYCEQFGAHGLRAIGIVDVSPKLLPGDDWPVGVGTPFSGEGLEDWRSRWESDPHSVVTDVYTMGFKDPAAHAAEIDWLVEESLRADRATAMDALTDAFACDFRAGLSRVEVPALLLYGAASTSTTPGVRAFMEQTIPRARLVVFEESGHVPMLEETEVFNRALHEFAKEVA